MRRKPLLALVLSLLLLGILVATTGVSLLPVSLGLGPCFKDWTATPSWSPRVSPLAAVNFAVGGKPVEVCYGRPAARGREVFGKLVPYDSLWRMGANEPTRLYTSSPLNLGGLGVPAGRYSLYAVPLPESWTIYVSQSILHWGIPIDAAVRAREIGSFTVRSEPASGPVEMLTIRAESDSGDRMQLVIEWEKTRVRIPMTPVAKP